MTGLVHAKQLVRTANNVEISLFTLCNKRIQVHINVTYIREPGLIKTEDARRRYSAMHTPTPPRPEPSHLDTMTAEREARKKGKTKRYKNYVM